LRYHLDKLYDHYDNNGGSSSRVHKGSDSSTTIDESECIDYSFHFMSKFQKYRASKSDVETSNCPNSTGWWKVNSTKFPVIAQIARDILAIPITMIAS
jgi:hypothetical protein